jgi:hypothetical protein
VHGAGGFDAHEDRFWQSGIELAHLIAVVLQFFLHQFAGVIVQHGKGLLSRVQIYAYNFHSRPPSFRAVSGWIPDILPGSS